MGGTDEWKYEQGPYSLTFLFLEFSYSWNFLRILLNHGKFSKNKKNSKN